VKALKEYQARVVRKGDDGLLFGNPRAIRCACVLRTVPPVAAETKPCRKSIASRIPS